MTAQPAQMVLTDDEAQDIEDAALIEALKRSARGGLPGKLGSRTQSPAFTVATLPTGWQAEAACVGAPPEVVGQFTEARSQSEAAEALEICQTCPVAAQCLSDARALRAWGTFGGHVLIDGRQAPRERPLAARQANLEPVVSLQAVPTIEDAHTEPAPEADPVVEVATPGKASDQITPLGEACRARRGGQRSQPKRPRSRKVRRRKALGR